MRFCDVDVCLGGDRNHVVRKNGVSVAEIEILRAIHGPDAVQNITPRHQKHVNTAEELDRLRRMYRRNVATADSTYRDVVSAVFSGPRPKLPTTLADVGVDWKGEEKPSRAKKKAAESVEEKEDESLME